MSAPPGPNGRSLERRVLDASLAGLLVAAWLGLLEALLLSHLRGAPELARALRDAVLGYAAFGAGLGLVAGCAIEAAAARRPAWRRRGFYLATFVIAVGLFQAVVHQQSATPGRVGLGSLSRAAAPALAGLLAIGLAWLVATRWRPPSSTPLVVGRGIGAALAAPLAAVIAWPAVPSRLPEPPEGLPNVLLIVMDTTRRDRLSVYGHSRPTTPALERIAAEGVTFTRGYSASPWTLPAHASIFTGRHPAEHGALHPHPRLDAHLPTLAEHLADRGYLTLAVARKLWLSSETGVMRGFDQFHDLNLRSATALAAAWQLAKRTWRERRGEDDKGARAVNARFMDLVRRHGERPFFAFLNYNEAHAGYRPPEPWRGRWLAAETPFGRGRRVRPSAFNRGEVEYDEADLAVFDDLYDAALAYQDHRMGELFDFLRERGALDRTLLIVTADHGENLGDHGWMGHECAVSETLIQVPLIVRLPGRVPAGARSEAPVESRRIWPLIDLVLGAAPGEAIPVERLAEALGSEGGPILSELFYAEGSHCAFQLRSLVDGPLKYVASPTRGEALYDLAADPGERRDLAAERAAELDRLRARLAGKLESLESHGGRTDAELSETLKEQLRAVGYLR